MHKHICKSCGSTMGMKKITKGSLLIEIVLWCCFIVPGVIYSIWRLTSKYDACKACNSPEIIPTNTPIGEKLLSEKMEAQKNLEAQTA